MLYSIIGENCKLGPWARVEGAPLVNDKQSIAILGTLTALAPLSLPLPPRSILEISFSLSGVFPLADPLFHTHPRAYTGKDVAVLKEVHIRSCIVLPSKVLSKSAKNEVLL